MHRDDVKPRGEVLTEMAKWLERDGIKLAGGLGFENAYALAMPRAKAEALGIHSITDLARHASKLSIAGDYEFFGRPEWASIKKAYGIGFREQRQMQAGFMYEAVAHGDADVIAGYTSDGRIAQYDLAILEDPKHAIPPYDAVLLVAPQRANDAMLLDALRPLVDAIDVSKMRAANLRASSGVSPAEAARALWDQVRSNGATRK
jgi:osmoprotectant transport system permease protein